MSWKEQALAVVKRFGPPVKFAVRQIVGAWTPGGPAVVELVGQAPDCVYRTTRDALEIDESRLPPATAADLHRLEQMLAVLGGDLAGLTEQAAALEGLPDAAVKILDVAVRTDDRCRAAVRRLVAVAQDFDALGEQYTKLLNGQGYAGPLLAELLPLMRRTAGAAAFIDDLCAAGPTADEFRAALADFRDGISALARGRATEAQERTDKLARSRPTSAGAAVALAAALALNGDFTGAQKSTARAARLRPQDAGLAELSRRLERAPRPAPAPAAPPKLNAQLKPHQAAGRLWINAQGIKFAWIPPGRFVMGSPHDEPQRRDDETQHGVTLTKGFWLGIHPVTQAQWKARMHDNASRFVDDDRPVERVIWREVAAFCRALGELDGRTYRLPTEAEWEYACRAGSTTAFHFGPSVSTDQANYDGRYSYGAGRGKYREETTPVGRFPPNRWGLFDMHGNVREWCQDWYAGAFLPDDVTDPQGGESGGFRVLRGGSWRDYPADCRSAAHHPRGPAVRDDNVGCRLVVCLDS